MNQTAKDVLALLSVVTLTAIGCVVDYHYKARKVMAAELPETHTPSKLLAKQGDSPKPRNKPTYSCAYETKWAGDRPHSTYTVWGGPWDDLQTALESVPPDHNLQSKMQIKDACVVRHNVNGTDETIYRWDQPKSEKTGYPEGPGRWVRAVGVK